MVKTLTHPVTGRTLRFGRRRPLVRLPHLALKNYTLASLPAPPPVGDYFTTPVVGVLSQMYGNDTLGDCVIAEMLHTAGVLTGNANGSPGAAVFTLGQAISLYSAITGYIPGDPSTDNGTVITDALAYWQQTGLLAGAPVPHKIAGSLSVDVANQEEVKTSIYNFENNVIGFELPDAWVDPVPSASGFIWDVAGPPDPSNGHCVLAFGYDSLGVIISTWGMVGHVTWPALAQYCSTSNGGELYTVISTDQLSVAKQRTPTGINWAQIESDFTALGGTLAVHL